MPSAAKSRPQNGKTRKAAAITRRVSPFPLALLDFQMGLTWMNEGRLDDARRSFEAAAWILGDVGRDGESRHWRRPAAARYDELVASHLEAFADHAAEFWLAAGADPHKALRLAKLKRMFATRRTPEVCWRGPLPRVN